jgi:hypothetical protein
MVTYHVTVIARRWRLTWLPPCSLAHVAVVVALLLPFTCSCSPASAPAPVHLFLLLLADSRTCSHLSVLDRPAALTCPYLHSCQLACPACVGLPFGLAGRSFLLAVRSCWLSVLAGGSRSCLFLLATPATARSCWPGLDHRSFVLAAPSAAHARWPAQCSITHQ